MSTWQITVLFLMAGCAIGCLLILCRVIEKLAKGILSVGTELKKMNAKVELVEVANRADLKNPLDRDEPDTSLDAIEAAISNFEKLKRIDLTKP